MEGSKGRKCASGFRICVKSFFLYVLHTENKARPVNISVDKNDKEATEPNTYTYTI